MRKRSFIKAHVGALVALSVFYFVTAEAQDVRQSNNQYGVSFQPPAGWQPDPIAQYAGPKRRDGTGPMLSLVAEDKLRDLSDNKIDALAKEVSEEISNEGIEMVQVADRQRRTIGGRNGLQLDVAYKIGDISLRQRRVYLPVSEHKRTYLFIFVDTAQSFDQTVPAADAAISSFALNGQPNGASGASADRELAGQKIPVALLAVLGALALAIMIGSGYLLLRRRANAQ